jgi:hypothetical protein
MVYVDEARSVLLMKPISAMHIHDLVGSRATSISGEISSGMAATHKQSMFTSRDQTTAALER